MGTKIVMSDEDLPAFMACLGIGTLHAIGTGTIPPTVGIWTLAVPRVTETLQEQRSFPREIVDVFETADELNFPDPRDVEVEAEGLVRRLQEELTNLPNPVWSISVESVPDAEVTHLG